MKKYAVVGFPLGHTMSPFIQKELFSLGGLDAEYGKFEVSPENLSQYFSSTLSLLDGFNVTIPHKTSIIPLLDSIDDASREYGAVNTVCRKDGKYFGFNTDAYGFLQGLAFSGIALEGKVLIYGFGGAARTIITESLKAGCDVTVATTPDRLAKAHSVTEELSSKKGKSVKLITNDEIDSEYDLLVNASPVGMYPNSAQTPIYAEQIGLFSQVYDIVYNPHKTELLRIAESQGKITGEGLSMLVFQAQQAHNIWYGAEFTRQQTKAVIEKAAAKLLEVFG